MDTKLAAFDMDGTLLDSNKKLPPDFVNWVKRHPEIKTVIASGRQYYRLVKDFLPVKDSIIFVAENGGLVFEREKIIYRNEMQKEDINRCLRVIDSIEGLTPVICGAESAYMVQTEKKILHEVKIYYARLQQVKDLYAAALQDCIVKIAVFVNGKMAESSMKYLSGLGGNLAAVLSGDSWIDLANRTASKGAAITAIQKRYGIDKRESMAFGDYLNDAQMLQCCEESYCMENGHPDLKILAKHITASNDNNGVMNVLHQFDFSHSYEEDNSLK